MVEYRREFLKQLATTALLGTNCFSLTKVSVFADETVVETNRVRIAHCCDPQLGFTPDTESLAGYDCDLERLKSEIEQLNRIQPDLVVFAGDMIHEESDFGRDMPEILRKIKAPVLIAPGNHDIHDPVQAKDVELFRSRYGYDYKSMECRGWKIIAANSQYWRPEGDAKLTATHNDWLRQEIINAWERKMPVILVTHVPPYASDVDEQEAYFNLPKACRQEWLDFFVEHGVKFWLAGHTHTTLVRAYRGMMIYNAETTSQNFDKHRYGFRLLDVDSTGSHSWEFKPVDQE